MDGRVSAGNWKDGQRPEGSHQSTKHISYPNKRSGPAHYIFNWALLRPIRQAQSMQAQDK